MKNAVFWDIKTQFVLHRRHITSPPQSPACSCYVRFAVFTAVTMKNAFFWDIKPQFVLHRRHITTPPQSPAGSCYVRFAVFTAVTMMNAVFLDVTSCGSSKNRRFDGTCRLRHQGDKNRLARNNVSSNSQLKHAAKKY
jgi:hypothetical protein